MMIAFGVEGLHCFTQRSNENLVFTRLLKDTAKGRERERSYICLPKCGVTTPVRDSTGLVRKHETVTVGRSLYPTYPYGQPPWFFTQVTNHKIGDIAGSYPNEQKRCKGKTGPADQNPKHKISNKNRCCHTGFQRPHF